MSKWLSRLVFFAGLLALWQALYALRIWPDYVLPGPLPVWRTFWSGIAEGSFLPGSLQSLRRLALGYSLSVGLGVALGMALAASKLLDETVGALALGLQTLPSVCWLPLAVLWFGLSDSAIVFVVVMGSLLSIAMATRAGVGQVPPNLVRAGRTMGASGLKLYFHVILPAALPSILEGMKQSWSFAWRSLMAAELIFASIGLGQLLNMGRELNDIHQVVAVMGMIVLLGLASDQLLFRWIEKRMNANWGFKRV
jgi:NitT/TauT family transport system permease protein